MILRFFMAALPARWGERREKMKVNELKEKKDELLEDFKNNYEEYFSENPFHRPYLSYGEDSEGNATQAYIGVEDEQGNAICAGKDEHLTDD